jgi:hypothetical protein
MTTNDKLISRWWWRRMDQTSIIIIIRRKIIEIQSVEIYGNKIEWVDRDINQLICQNLGFENNQSTTNGKQKAQIVHYQTRLNVHHLTTTNALDYSTLTFFVEGGCVGWRGKSQINRFLCACVWFAGNIRNSNVTIKSPRERETIPQH